MEANKILNSSLDDLVFEGRNKNYGAYDLRKKYSRHVNIAMAITLALIILGFSFPYIKALLDKSTGETKKMTTVDVTKLAAPPPLDKTTPPPPPPSLPPPPPKTVKFTPPVVKPDEEVKPEEEPPKQEELQKAEPAAQTNIDPNANINFNEAPVNQVVEAPPQKPLMFVEQMPTFPGGEEALNTYLSKHVNYPAPAREAHIEGTVVLQFVVQPDGSISDVTVKRPVGGGCTEEAVRVVKSMPRWSPGKQNGNAVPVYFVLPFTFTLTQE